MVAKEEQGAEDGGEEVLSNAIKTFPDRVGDGGRPRGGGG